jgi:hypothetical protein
MLTQNRVKSLNQLFKQKSTKGKDVIKQTLASGKVQEEFIVFKDGLTKHKKAEATEKSHSVLSLPNPRRGASMNCDTPSRNSSKETTEYKNNSDKKFRKAVYQPMFHRPANHSIQEIAIGAASKQPPQPKLHHKTNSFSYSKPVSSQNTSMNRSTNSKTILKHQLSIPIQPTKEPVSFIQLSNIVSNRKFIGNINRDNVRSQHLLKNQNMTNFLRRNKQEGDPQSATLKPGTNQLANKNRPKIETFKSETGNSNGLSTLVIPKAQTIKRNASQPQSAQLPLKKRQEPDSFVGRKKQLEHQPAQQYQVLQITTDSILEKMYKDLIKRTTTLYKEIYLD